MVPLFSSKNLDELPLRVQRFRLRLMRFQFSISHVPGKSLTTADALSRAPSSEPLEGNKLRQDEADVYANMVVKALPATERRIKQIQQHQEKDEVCRQIAVNCYQGCPKDKYTTTLPFYCRGTDN